MAKPAFDPAKPFEPAKAKPAFDPSKPFEIVAEPEGPGLAEKIETGARSALEGVTLGVSEPVISGINAFVGNLITAGFNAEDIGEFAKQAVSQEAIKQEYERDVARRRSLEAQLPEVAIPSEIAGGILGGLATGGAATAGRAARALTTPMRAVEGLAGVAGKAVPTAVGQAAARGAVSAAGAEAVKGLAQVPTGVAMPEEISVTGAAEFGGLLGGGLTAAGKGIQAAIKAAPKVLSALGGVSQDAIEQYVKDPGALIRAKSPEEIKDLIDSYSGQLAQAVEDGKVAASEAQSALDSAKRALAAEEAARRAEFASAKFDAQIASKEAQSKLNDAIKIAKTDTEAVMTSGKMSLRDQSVAAVDALKEKVKKQSAESYKILEKAGRTVSVKPAIDAAEAALESLKIQGKAPTVGASAQAYKQIEGYLQDLKRYKNILSTSDAKKKIQQLDQDWQAALTAGEFTSDAQQALRSIRRAFDEQLKDIPAYAKIMEELSSNTDLLGRANKLYGNAEKAGVRVARIDLPTHDQERALLIELGNATKRNFEDQLSAIQQAGVALKGGAIEAGVMAGPIGKEARAAEAVLGKMQRPEALPSILAAVEAGPQAQAVRAAQEKLAARQAQLAAAQQKIKDLGPFARPLSNISAIRTAVTGKNPEYRKFLETLSKMSGEDFVQYVNDLKLAEQFQKEFRIGSRNVNLWGLGSGAAVYGLTGDPTAALVVAGLGGGFGGLVDRFGPAMTQKVLDGYLKIQGMPTVQKVEAAFAGLPREVITQVKNDLIRSISVADSEEIMIDPLDADSVKLDILNSDLSAVQKAKMVKAIGSAKPVSSSDLGAVMIGKKAKPPLYMERPQPETLKMDKPDVLKALEQRARQQ